MSIARRCSRGWGWILLACSAATLAATPPPLSNPDATPEAPLGPRYYGALTGAASVSAAGNATYSIPLPLPPGTNGVAPSLSIHYNSNMKNGLLGVGFFLQGASSQITRCPQTLSQDGQIHAVDFTDEDRFCLDGQRLVLVNGGVYGDPGTEYRTEIDSFQRITAHGAVAGGTGPEYFTVESADGVERQYGYTTDSRIEAQGQSTVRAWAMNRVEDVSSNYYTLEYKKQSGSSAYRPLRIHYTGNANENVMPYAQISFFYESRDDKPRIYRGGSRVIDYALRLNRIKVEVDANLVMEYRLAYEDFGLNASLAPTGDLSRLIEIKRCDSAGLCQEPITFDWWADQNGTPVSYYDITVPADTQNQHQKWYNPRWHDLNGDGTPDYVHTVQSGGNYSNYTAQQISGTFEVLLSGPSGYTTDTWTTPGIAPHNRFYDIIWADMDGDGRVDMVTPTWSSTATSTDFQIAFSTGTDFDVQTWTGYPHLLDGREHYFYDMNGDKLLDLVVKEWDSTYEFYNGCNLTPVTRNEYTIKVALNTGTGFGTLNTWLSNVTHNSEFADMNGDGLMDYIAATYIVYMNNGAGFDTGAGFGSPGPPVCHTPYYYDAVLVGDLNSDGLTDRYNAYVGYQYNTGTGFVTAGTIAMFPHSDLNGNGKNDHTVRTFVKRDDNHRYTNASKWYMRDDAGTSVIGKGLLDDWELSHFQQVVDINGDGINEYTANRTHYCEPHSHPSQARWCETDQIRVYQGDNPPHHLLRKVTTGLGFETEFTYKPLTDHSIYTKGTSAVLPIEDVQDGTHVVTTFTQPDGIGGLVTVNYTYEGLQRDHGGRGLLGFAKITATNVNTDATTITEYEQTFPYSSQPKLVEVRRTSDNRLLQKTETTYQVYGTVGSGPVFSYVDNRVVSQYALNTGSLTSTTTTTNSVDQYGNITDSTVYVLDIAAWNNTQTQVTSQYTHDVSNWRVKQLDASTTQHWLVGVHDQSLDRHVNYYYYPSGQLENVIREEGMGTGLELTKTLVYDEFGNVNQETTSAPGITSRTSTMTYDSRGRFVLELKNPLAHTITQTWNEDLGTKATQTDPNGQTTSWTYDTFGSPVRETRPDSTYTETKFYEDNSGFNPHAVSYSEILGTGQPPARVFQDLLGRTVRTRSQGFDGAYINTDTNYDNRGRAFQTSEPYFENDTIHWNTNYYDHLNRVVWFVAADNTQSYINVYSDDIAHQVQTINSDAQSAYRWVNALGQLRKTRDRAGTETRFNYDAAGHRIEVVNDYQGAQQNSVTYTYDRLGRQLTQTDPDHGTYTRMYDALDQVRFEISPKMAQASQSVELQYDVLGRLTTRIEPEGTTTWSFDDTTGGNLGIGKLHNENQTGFNRTFDYAPGNYGRLTATSTVIDGGTPYVAAVTYNAQGKVDTQTYPSGFAVKSQYNALGYLERIRETVTGNSAYYQLTATDASGRVTQEWLGDGSLTAVTYDGTSGRIDEQHTTNGVIDIQHFSYDYDTLGNMEARSDVLHGLTETFTFDNLERLTSAQVTGASAVNYNFDAIGNITEKSDTGNPYSYTTSALHAVTQIQVGPTTQHLNYDIQGNLQNGDDLPTITWASYNKPTQLTKGGITYQFAYGPNRSRYKKIKGSETTHYIGGSHESITTPTTTKERDVLRVNGRTIMLRKHDSATATTEHEYVHRDHLGSITALTREFDGSVIERYSYDAWGKRRSATDWTASVTSVYESRGYTGHEHLDDLEVIHMNGRIYSPKLGRMLSPDPITQAPNSGRNYNRYTYAFNNPLGYVDPSGWCTAVASAGGYRDSNGIWTLATSYSPSPGNCGGIDLSNISLLPDWGETYIGSIITGVVNLSLTIDIVDMIETACDSPSPQNAEVCASPELAAWFQEYGNSATPPTNGVGPPEPLVAGPSAPEPLVAGPGDGRTQIGDAITPPENSELSTSGDIRVGSIVSFSNRIFGFTLDFGSAKTSDMTGGYWTNNGYVATFSEGRTLTSVDLFGVVTLSAENTTYDNGDTWNYGPLTATPGPVIEFFTGQPVNIDVSIGFGVVYENTFTFEQ